MEIMRFLPEGLNPSKIQVWFKLEFNPEICKPPSKIQVWFKLEFNPEICKSKSIEIWKLGQK
jgi:hypothetical protein